MKIRQGYVSNSSSSSFVIAYDPLFFGNIRAYFQEYSFGCETCIYDIKDFTDSMPNYKEKIDAMKAEGKQVLYFWLDQEFYPIIALMKMINESNGGDKMKIIYGDEDE